MKKKLLTGIISVLLIVTLVVPLAMAESLRYKDKGSQVTQVQARLKQLGYFGAKVDGIYDYSTVMAVKAFQAKNTLTIDGVVGEKTYKALYSPFAVTKDGGPGEADVGQRVAYGSTGPGVVAVQNALIFNGYYSGLVDGKYGYATVVAVRKFQADKHLKADGIVGPKTWAVLTGAMLPPPPPPPPPPKTSWKYTDVGPKVLQIQQRLNVLKYNAGAEDGVFGYETYLAVRHFQKVNSLKVDGIVGADTDVKLFAMAAIPNPDSVPPGPRYQYKDTDPAVLQLETKLSTLDYLDIAFVDNYYSLETVEAVRVFQKVHGLTIDGIVGPKTWNVLFSGSAKINPGVVVTPPEASKGSWVKYGEKGARVKEVQDLLVGLHYLAAEYADSSFGYRTYLAVKQFQKINSLKADGIVGKTTWDALHDPGALPNP